MLMGVVAAATTLLAKMMEPILDQVFSQRSEEHLVEVAVMVLAVFVVKGFATYGQAVLMNRVGQRIVAELQVKLFQHLIGADIAYFHATTTGTLMSRLINDAMLLRAIVSNLLTNLGKDLLTLVFLVALMFYQDWVLASVAFLAFPTAVVPILRIGKRMRKVSANTQAEMAEFTTLLEQVFQGARHVKAYGMEQYETGRVSRLVGRLSHLMQKAARIRSASHPIMETLGGIAITVVILYGGWQVIQGQRTTGAFFSFVTALLLAYEPMKRLVQLNASLQEGLAAAVRVFQVLDLEPRIVDAPAAKPLAVSAGAIRFEEVRFGYVPGRPALAGLSLSVPAGRTAALVGASGAGKSTILNLIPRFYDVDGGRVSIDGQDVREVTLVSLRQSIALVSQEVSLFDDTVAANIGYGRQGAGSAEIEAAARHAAAHEFIQALPQGYDTLVGEHGIKLSGGQRQRLAIARAMLKNAPILLLDEATSALDTENERLVQKALKELMQGRTTVVIAHRLATVMDAHVIYVIDAGRVVESGSHGELIARGGIYARLYHLQFAEEAAGEPVRVRA
ncbi:MAG: ATP-binding cassette domain-containing protein [Proteobacteria bacterium]|nr:ATP-binding cassette domain-containing protein [Pseudomonadota bacterium]MBI3499386.1 ATP-binding cassette domain-containing protein [Pseudomonadota bacterium]